MAFHGSGGCGEQAELCSWLWQRPGTCRTSRPSDSRLFVCPGETLARAELFGAVALGALPSALLAPEGCHRRGVTSVTLSTPRAPGSTHKSRLWGVPGQGELQHGAGIIPIIDSGLCPLHCPLPAPASVNSSGTAGTGDGGRAVGKCNYQTHLGRVSLFLVRVRTERGLLVGALGEACRG